MGARRWFAKVIVTKGGAAGKGPDPPEPPPMSTDGSSEYPAMLEELDTAEVEGKTKMAFAKMQIPANIRDLHLLVDQDFITNKDEAEEVVASSPPPEDQALSADDEAIPMLSETNRQGSMRENSFAEASETARSRGSLRNMNAGNDDASSHSDSFKGEATSGGSRKTSRRHTTGTSSHLSPGTNSPNTEKRRASQQRSRGSSRVDHANQAAKMGLYA